MLLFKRSLIAGGLPFALLSETLKELLRLIFGTGGVFYCCAGVADFLAEIFKLISLVGLWLGHQTVLSPITEWMGLMEMVTFSRQRTSMSSDHTSSNIPFQKVPFLKSISSAVPESEFSFLIGLKIS